MRFRRPSLARALVVGIILLVAIPSVTGAQSSQRCFAETNYCISGRIREFWEQNGSLPVFGLPITPLQTERIEGRPLLVQWFERARLELHPDQPRPYDVQLGRLGAERVRAFDRAAATAPAPAENCMFFDVTQQHVCGAVLEAWRAYGLELDGQPGTTYDENLALFGLPLTDLKTEILSDGHAYQVQWFERGRFELHPEHTWPANVLLGLLGREAAPIPQAPATMPQAAPPVRLVIDAIHVDQRITEAGLDATGAPIVPDHTVGWFNQSAMPGQGENIVLWGHVLRFQNAPHIPAPFARLKELRPGASVVLYDDSGQAHQYVVTQQIQVTPNQVDYILPQGHERLTMISCIGQQIIVNGDVVDMSHRLITIAEPEG